MAPCGRIPSTANRTPARTARPFTAAHRPRPHQRAVSARAESEDDFEARLQKLAAPKKGQHRGGNKSKQGQIAEEDRKSSKNAAKKREVDYSNETVWREMAPARADLITNIALGATLVWLPLTFSAIGRCAFVKYKVTDKRLVVITEAPWKKDESQVGFHEVSGVVGVNRGFGLYGDMVVTLTSGDKLELRSIPQWTEVRDYILERRNAIRGKDISAEELMGA